MSKKKKNVPEEYEAEGMEMTEETAAEEESVEINLTDEELTALCRERVCVGCDQMKEANDERLRNLAEMENFKKRLGREQDEFRKYAVDKVLADLLPILDNLGLALEHARTNEACKDIVMGVDMTVKMFLDTVRTHGLSQVGAVGETFNPEIHEAMGTEPFEGMDTGLVGKILQPGYKLGERLLRPAKVMVTE